MSCRSWLLLLTHKFALQTMPCKYRLSTTYAHILQQPILMAPNKKNLSSRSTIPTISFQKKRKKKHNIASCRAAESNAHNPSSQIFPALVFSLPHFETAVDLLPLYLPAEIFRLLPCTYINRELRNERRRGARRERSGRVRAHS